VTVCEAVIKVMCSEFLFTLQVVKLVEDGKLKERRWMKARYHIQH